MLRFSFVQSGQISSGYHYVAHETIICLHISDREEGYIKWQDVFVCLFVFLPVHWLRGTVLQISGWASNHCPNGSSQR